MAILADWNLVSVRMILLKIKGLLRRHCISGLVCRCLCGLDFSRLEFSFCPNDSVED